MFNNYPSTAMTLVFWKAVCAYANLLLFARVIWAMKCAPKNANETNYSRLP